MGGVLSHATCDTETANQAPADHGEVIVEVQKVTFADPPASDAKPSPAPAQTGPLESVLKREGAPRRNRTARAVTATPTSISTDRPRRTIRTPARRAADTVATPVAAPAPVVAAPAPEVIAAVEAAVAPPAPAAAVARASKRAAKKKAAAAKKAPAAATAAPAPELVVVGKAIRQKGAVPARKVGMKRMAKRALKPAGAAATTRATRSKK